MKKGKRDLQLLLYVIFIILLTINFISAAAIGEDLHLNIQTTNSTGSVVTGTFNFTFNISTTSDCANVVYTNYTNLTTDSRGIISYYLNNVVLNFSDQYWLCYYRDGVLINNSKIARTPYTYRAKNITISGIEPDANLDIGIFNITSSWFFGLYNWIIGLIGIGSSNNYLIFNGSTLSFNETYLNGTILSEGIRLGFDSTYNATYASYASNVSRNWTIDAINILSSNFTAINTTAGLVYTINTTANIQNLLNGTGIYSTPLTINTTANIGNLYNFTSGLIANKTFLQNFTLATIQGFINNTNMYFASLGIGTTSHLATLQVNSSNSLGAFAVYNSSNSAALLFVNGTSGNVGIGTASPTAKLDVVGNVSISGNMSLSGYINQTVANNVTRYFSNGCYELVNTTGLYWIC
jgi:hypothetical protein